MYHVLFQSTQAVSDLPGSALWAKLVKINRGTNTPRRSNVPEGPAQVEFAQVGIHYTYGKLCVCSQGNTVEIQTPALGPDRLHDRPGSCVIGQQYSSAAFVSLRLHYRKENSGARLKNVTIPVLKLISNRVSLKLCNLKLCKAGECQNAISLLQTNSSSHCSFLNRIKEGLWFVRLVAPWRRRIAPLLRPQTCWMSITLHQCETEIPCQEVL